MIILDTNVLSELMRPQPEPLVLDWIFRNGQAGLCTTSISQAEILAGLAVMPAGRRRRELEASAKHVFAQPFFLALPFDAQAAPYFAAFSAARQEQGLHVQIADAMIAAIALSHDAAVATRNLLDFEGCGIRLHDPWRAT
jgi:predicted nucleic acid-binding protein